MREMSDIGVAALMRNRRDREIGTRQQDLCAGAPQVLKCDGGTQPEYLPKQPVQVAAGDVWTRASMNSSVLRTVTCQSVRPLPPTHNR